MGETLLALNPIQNHRFLDPERSQKHPLDPSFRLRIAKCIKKEKLNQEGLLDNLDLWSLLGGTLQIVIQM